MCPENQFAGIFPPEKSWILNIMISRILQKQITDGVTSIQKGVICVMKKFICGVEGYWEIVCRNFCTVRLTRHIKFYPQSKIVFVGCIKWLSTTFRFGFGPPPKPAILGVKTLRRNNPRDYFKTAYSIFSESSIFEDFWITNPFIRNQIIWCNTCQDKTSG